MPIDFSAMLKDLDSPDYEEKREERAKVRALEDGARTD
jgi:hypothetical protein